MGLREKGERERERRGAEKESVHQRACFKGGTLSMPRIRPSSSIAVNDNNITAIVIHLKVT